LNNKEADTASLQRMTSELNQIMQQMGAAAYGAAGQPGGAGANNAGGNPGGDSGTPPDDNVVDGEFKEK
ncbi:MAG: molecular chaperone DnaK, partial [Chloroflexi bacterium]|nr:molecular chaperone DnaK [Chloroflexota bacterium]